MNETIEILEAHTTSIKALGESVRALTVGLGMLKDLVVVQQGEIMKLQKEKKSFIHLSFTEKRKHPLFLDRK